MERGNDLGARIQETVEWYKKYSDRYENIESVLVAHPRQGASREFDM